jgi:HEPN domain-containing protein
VRKDTENWIATAEYDFATARSLLDTGRYPYVIFFCHLALEKLLKALVTETTQSIPPKTHDLLELRQLAGLAIPEPHLSFVGTINTVSIVTRYPSDLGRLQTEYPEAIARRYLVQTEEVYRWLKNQPNWPT